MVVRVGGRQKRESGREKGEGKDWKKLGGVGGWRRKKVGYRSRKEYIYIKGAILGLSRDLTLVGIPGVHGDVPS